MDLTEVKDLENNNKLWLILRLKVHEEKIKKAFILFRSQNIEPILIKGWAAAREYPDNSQRLFNDIDITVSPNRYESAADLLENVEAKKLNIDLHRGLRHLDTVPWEDLFRNSITVDLDDVPIRILRPEDHLRVLCVHWLTDGGADKKRLLDVKYILEKNADGFDWNRCLGVVSRKRQNWILTTIAAAKRFYGLDDVVNQPLIDTLRIPMWFISALEKEWASDVRLLPIQTTIFNRKALLKQLKKRFPPNAIQATIDVEGDFNEFPRTFYQIGSVFVRLKPSLKRIFFVFSKKFKDK